MASSVLVRRVINILIVPFRGAPELADWKSDVLIDTKGTRASSVNGDVQEESDYVHEVSIPGSGLEPEVVGRGEVKF